MAASLPTIVLVQGAWHTPANYKSYSDALEAQGFKVLCPQLPSCNNKSPPVSSFTEDNICTEAGFAELWPQFIQNFDDGSTFPVDPSLLFLGSVEQDIVDKALSNLVRSPMSAFEAKSKGDAWRRVPVTYILTQQDYSVPRLYQDLMLEKVKSEGVVIKTKDYETCHSVFITKEKEMVDAVVVAASDKRNLI
ncbi:uncharacterized protein EAF01_005729 [Botrytis porri]|uniref:uncharacterized protein n=1 Tax=Botrytis porri TaxID=87229 RepID=UPI0018FF614A|nr:uncharacterized protein EAF01_005729 [Botrytis porri]KAF7905208.1 hypothetical protein EAF01_005729 [Botrytis porri]